MRPLLAVWMIAIIISFPYVSSIYIYQLFYRFQHKYIALIVNFVLYNFFYTLQKIGFNPLIIIETKKIKLKNVNEKIDVETLNADNRDVAVVLIYVLTSEFFMR